MPERKADGKEPPCGDSPGKRIEALYIGKICPKLPLETTPAKPLGVIRNRQRAIASADRFLFARSLVYFFTRLSLLPSELCLVLFSRLYFRLTLLC